MKYELNTSLPIQFEKVEEIEDSRFLKAKIYVCHTGKNLNNSYFDKQTIQNAIDSLANIPVLGFIEVNNLNEADFKGHEQRLVIDKDGISVEYLGRAYGLVPQDNNARFEMRTGEDGVEREYLVCDVLMWTKFPESIDIIERDGVKNHSMELDPSSIQGKFNKQGVFEYTSFKFEGLCLLGNDVTPAMKGSVLEKFNRNTHEQFKEMFAEFNQFYSTYINQSSKTDDINKEGGENVDEKLELFTKFPTLKEEDVAEIKTNLEQFSLEELEAKLNELVEAQGHDGSNTDFALTAQQKEQEIRAALSQERYTDRWGDSSRAYWYIDHDENRVYAEDVQNGYLPVGLNYSSSGDSITIDFTSKKRIKWVPQDLEDGVQSSVNFVSVERSQFEIEKVKEDTKKEVESQFEQVQQELDEIKPQFETLKTEKAELETEVAEFAKTDAQEKVATLETQIQELSAYKLAREKQDKLEIINKFTQLSDEDKKPFIEEVDKFSAEDLEDKLFAVVGRKGLANFPNKKDKENLVVVTDFSAHNKNSNQPAWAELVEEYKNKNN